MLADALDKAGLEWVEADVAGCPGAAAQMAKAEGLQWIQPGLLAPQPDGDAIELVIHADTIKVEFRALQRTSAYHCWIAPGSPAEWAKQLADALESCWRPLAALPPWRLGPPPPPPMV